MREWHAFGIRSEIYQAWKNSPSLLGSGRGLFANHMRVPTSVFVTLGIYEGVVDGISLGIRSSIENAPFIPLFLLLCVVSFPGIVVPDEASQTGLMVDAMA